MITSKQLFLSENKRHSNSDPILRPGKNGAKRSKHTLAFPLFARLLLSLLTSLPSGVMSDETKLLDPQAEVLSLKNRLNSVLLRLDEVTTKRNACQFGSGEFLTWDNEVQHYRKEQSKLEAAIEKEKDMPRVNKEAQRLSVRNLASDMGTFVILLELSESHSFS